MKPEDQLEKDLSKIARYMKRRYIKIPDINKINFRNKNFVNKEYKRPFDGILISKNKNFCIECKIDSNALLSHQEINQTKINTINNTFFVIRKRRRKNCSVYQIEQNHNLLFETTDIREIIKYFDKMG